MSAEDWTLADFRRHVPRIIAERDAALAEVDHLRGLVEDFQHGAAAFVADRIAPIQAERDAARAEAEELRRGYRTVCDYAEQHDATRASLNGARAALAAVAALCDAADEASLRPDHPGFEPIQVPWTTAVRAALAVPEPGEQPTNINEGD